MLEVIFRKRIKRSANAQNTGLALIATASVVAIMAAMGPAANGSFVRRRSVSGGKLAASA